MAFMEWSPAISVGVPLIDADHRAFIRLVNRLHDNVEAGAKEEDLADMFDRLIAYAEIHLAREEKVMEVCGFPNLARHAEEHAGFTHTIYALRERYAEIGDTAVFRDLLAYLKGWFETHVAGQDTALHRFAADNPQANDVAAAFGPPAPG